MEVTRRMVCSGMEASMGKVWDVHMPLAQPKPSNYWHDEEKRECENGNRKAQSRLHR